MKKNTLIIGSQFISQESFFKIRIFMLLISIANYVNLIIKRNFSIRAFRFMTMNGWLFIVVYLIFCLIHTMNVRKGNKFMRKRI